MTRPCADADGALTPEAADEILAAAERAGAVALGPGLGRTDGAGALVGFLLDRLEKPVVLDADGLWALTGHLDWVFSRDAPTVLTPHAGELGRLLGRPSAWVDANRLDAVQAGADDAGTVVLLKGADTLVAGPGRQPVVVDLGNPGLATAGSGDVLTGVVASVPGQGDGGKPRGRGRRRGLRRRLLDRGRASRAGGADRPRRRRGPLAGALGVKAAAVTRSQITVDLPAIRRNAAFVREAAAPAELWAVVKADALRTRSRWCGAGGARGRRHLPLCRHRSRGRGGARGVSVGPHSRPGPHCRQRGGGCPRRATRARTVLSGSARGPGRPPEGRHRHGPVGYDARRRADCASPTGRRRHEPPRHGRRGGRRVREGADRPLPRGRRRLSRRDRPPGQQRRRAALPRGAVRRGSVRGRALRAFAVRRRSGAPWARAGAVVAELRRPGARAPERARAPATGAASSPRSRCGSASSRSGTGTASGEGSRARRCSSARPAGKSSARSPWTLSPSSSGTSRWEPR